MKNPNAFEESLAADALSEEQHAAQERRLQVYSAEALRMAVSVEKIYVKHSQFATALQQLDRLFQLGTELSTPLGMRLIGPPGVGKTALLRYFRDSLPSSALYDKTCGVLAIRLPNRPYSGHLIRALLGQLRYPFTSGTHRQLYERRRVVFEALKSKGTRLIVLDEAQHLVSRSAAGSPKTIEGDAAEFLRELMDETRVSLVLSGSKDLDDLSLSLDHLSSRINLRIELNEFALDASWGGFLKVYSKLATVFDMSLITEPDVIAKLHVSTRGNARQFRQLIIEAILIAADVGKRALDYETLRTAYTRAFGESASRSNPFV
ncbi:TniB family NTP-binding protein [Hydrogenophaga taeniospiralis]|uniref:TniB family NTP-binding protein n=1 Tax=Hydrogenophaga taeniospiralis TaxID=65656 RepID=UPI001CFAFE23|nr:TniB family NTP-binding protein [Hydrogenophaga taeniospiralis]UCU93348.1 TniB family NTP-binding protein [Hydrogenophaga taeniospiralis]